MIWLPNVKTGETLMRSMYKQRASSVPNSTLVHLISFFSSIPLS